jgi:RNA polymerase-interacting CarD/CdnL/TRCF family regulator
VSRIAIKAKPNLVRGGVGKRGAEMKRTIIGLLVAAALLFLLGRGKVTASQEGGPSPTRDETAQLAERVKLLESEVKALTDKYEQSAGFSDTEYVLRIQRHYEEYYEKVLSTQTNMMWAVGILLTVLLSVAGLFSFRQFDRQIDFTSRRVAAEQRVEFERRLEADLKELEKRNNRQVSRVIEEITKRTDQALKKLELSGMFYREHDRGLAFAALGQHKESIAGMRRAVELYAMNKERGIVGKETVRSVIANLFRAIYRMDNEKFEDNAKKELGRDFYKNLSEELALAASSYVSLAPLLDGSERSAVAPEEKLTPAGEGQEG